MLGAIAVAYVILWGATATLGVESAQSVAAGENNRIENWDGYAPAPFWVVAAYDSYAGSTTIGGGYRTHFVFTPWRTYEAGCETTAFYCGSF